MRQSFVFCLLSFVFCLLSRTIAQPSCKLTRQHSSIRFQSFATALVARAMNQSCGVNAYHAGRQLLQFANS